MGDPGDHVGVGDHQAGGDDEARAFLDLSTALPHDLDRGGPGGSHRGVHGGVVRQRYWTGRGRRQLGEDGWESLLGEKCLHPGEDRGGSRKHVVQGADDRGVGDHRVEAGIRAVDQRAGHQPHSEKGGHHGHANAQDRVHRAELSPMDGLEGSSAQDASGRSQHDCAPHHGDQGHRGAGGLGVYPVHGLAEARMAPRYMPSQNPTNERVSSTAPRRRPSMAATATTTSNRTSRMFTARGRPYTGRGVSPRVVSPPGNGRRVSRPIWTEFTKIHT